MKVDDPKLAEYLIDEIFYADCYQLKLLTKKHVSTIVDIGANNGFFALYARILFPKSRIVCFEPCKETFLRLVENVENLKIECENLGLGDGRGISMIPNIHTSDSGSFVGIPDGEIPTKSFSGLTSDLPINLSTVVKIDCEGAERFLVQNLEDVAILAQAGRWMMEVHYDEKLWPESPGRLFYEEFYENFKQQFSFDMNCEFKEKRGMIIAQSKLF